MTKTFWTNDVYKAAEYCKENFKENTQLSISIANDVLENRFLFRDHWEMERTNIPTVFETEVKWNHIPFDDPEWLYAMNRHSCFVNLGKAFLYTGEDKYAKKFAELISHFIKTEPLTEDSKKNTWRSLEVGLRCESWLRSLKLFEKSEHLTDKLKKEIEACLLVHGEFLKSESFVFHKLSNWGVLQDHGLFLLGIYFDKQDWTELAVTRLNACLAISVFADGSQWEQSPMYHCEVLHCALDVALTARQNNITLPGEYLSRVKDMCTALAKWLTPNGRLICQSDSDNVDARDLVAAGAIFFNDGYLRSVAGNHPFEENIWDFGTEARSMLELVVSEPAEHPSSLLLDSGNYMLRSDFSPDAAYLHMHCGCLGSGHGHADLLHIDVGAYGEDILIDSGRYTYVDTPLRKELKLPSAHNTITVDKEDFSECVNSWGYSKLAQPVKGEHKLTKQLDYISGSHLGYLFATKGTVFLTRHIVHIRPDIFVVFDCSAAMGEHLYQLHWHLGEGSTAADERGLLWTGKRSAMRLEAVFNSAALSMSKAPYSKDYNDLRRGDKATVEIKAQGSVIIPTVIRVGGINDDVSFKTELLPVTTSRARRAIEAKDAIGVKITAGKQSFALLCCNAELISEVDLLSIDGYEGYGKLIVFNKENSNGTTLVW